MGSLQNQVRDFTGLARKPLCYRYTIPQYFQILRKRFTILATDKANPVQACALLTARPRPWQARGNGLPEMSRSDTAAIWRRGSRRSQGRRHERVFRRAGFPPDANGRAQPAAPEAALLRPRHIRNQTRRRVLDGERLHSRRDYARAAGVGGDREGR